MNKETYGWNGNDKNEYLDFCIRAAADNAVFATFKQNHAYRQILEHVSNDLGLKYYNLLDAEYKALVPEAHKVNDSIGSPSVMEVPEGLISPSTLRYLLVLQHLDQTSIGGHIVEAGAGYGGMARMVLKLAKNKENILSYTTVDLYGPSLVQAKYNQDIPNFRAVAYEDFEKTDADFFMSNYAFAELPISIQDVYLEKVIKESKHGYMAYNPGAGHEYDYPGLEKAMGIKVSYAPDHPMVDVGYGGNKIITW